MRGLVCKNYDLRVSHTFTLNANVSAQLKFKHFHIWPAVADKNTCCRISNTSSKYIQLILGTIQLMEKNISLVVKNMDTKDLKVYT